MSYNYACWFSFRGDKVPALLLTSSYIIIQAIHDKIMYFHTTSTWRRDCNCTTRLFKYLCVSLLSSVLYVFFISFAVCVCSCFRIKTEFLSTNSIVSWNWNNSILLKIVASRKKSVWNKMSFADKIQFLRYCCCCDRVLNSSNTENYGTNRLRKGHASFRPDLCEAYQRPIKLKYQNKM